MNALFLNTPELLAEWFPKAEKHFQPVIDQAARGEFEVSDIRRLCEENRALTMVVIDGAEVILAMAFEFIFYPRMTACNIMALGGNRLKEAEEAFFVTFKSWCYNMGVTVIEASCSSAMARLLKGYGFEKTYEVVRHEIRLPREPRPTEL